jgi:hypothetical protein
MKNMKFLLLSFMITIASQQEVIALSTKSTATQISMSTFCNGDDCNCGDTKTDTPD